MTDLLLRHARSTDAGKLGAMISEAVAAFDWKPLLHSGAEDIDHVGKMIDRGWVTVAAQGGAVVGFIAREESRIHALYVTAQAQGSGIGTALLNTAKEAVSRLELWTFQANEGAQRFYEREGFVVDRRTDGADNDEKLPDVHYVWQGPYVLKTQGPAND
ncbi:GNAT family N-acetyltransferase [Primorskyibacter sp. 2E233]|uniref:GNAT family N-acetyltransferase n=1 Tax=Primorskyibacter sp. 2E233 TaxID=3413431 RepID=UPI003BF1052E